MITQNLQKCFFHTQRLHYFTAFLCKKILRNNLHALCMCYACDCPPDETLKSQHKFPPARLLGEKLAV